MERLRHRDIVALLRFLQHVHAIRILDRFADQVGSALALLIPNDYYVFAEVDGLEHKTSLAVSHPSISSIVPNFQEIFNRYGHENPLPTAHRGYVGALKMSDFLTQQQLRRLTLYNELFRPGGVHYQMSVVLPSKSGILRGIVVNRRTRDFSERDRLMLDLIRPHLAQARQNAAILDSWRRSVEEAGHEIVCLDGRSRVTFSSGRAAALMSEYFLGWVSRGDRLPEALDRWVQQQRERFHKASDNLPTIRPFVAGLENKRLVIRLICGADSGQGDILLLDEQQMQMSLESLTAIGLSRREAEVLSLVIQGRTVADIAHILTIASSTVEKHLENIYVKLDVHSRGAAVAKAFTVMGVTHSRTNEKADQPNNWSAERKRRDSNPRSRP